MTTTTIEYVIPRINTTALKDVIYALDSIDLSVGHGRLSGALEMIEAFNARLTSHDLRQLHFAYILFCDALTIETWHRQVVQCQVLQSKTRPEHYILIVTGSILDWKDVLAAEEEDNQFNEQVSQIHSYLLTHGMEKYLGP
jgi:hypothetical protein